MIPVVVLLQVTMFLSLCAESVASMDEVIHSAPWRPWQNSAIVPAALLQRDWNTSPSKIGFIIRTPIYFAELLLLLHCCGGEKQILKQLQTFQPAY
jgi:hypothetical protein